MASGLPDMRADELGEAEPLTPADSGAEATLACMGRMPPEGPTSDRGLATVARCCAPCSLERLSLDEGCTAEASVCGAAGPAGGATRPEGPTTKGVVLVGVRTSCLEKPAVEVAESAAWSCRLIGKDGMEGAARLLGVAAAEDAC